MSHLSTFDSDTDTLTADPEIEEPRFYEVVLLNDDYTTMDFVIDVLIIYFHKSRIDAEKIMFTIHYTGSGVAGVYPHDIAETKAHQVVEYARKNGHPLQCEIRPK